MARAGRGDDADSVRGAVMIVFVGGMVGFVVISMYLPMFSIYENIR